MLMWPIGKMRCSISHTIHTIYRGRCIDRPTGGRRVKADSVSDEAELQIPDALNQGSQKNHQTPHRAILHLNLMCNHFYYTMCDIIFYFNSRLDIYSWLY